MPNIDVAALTRSLTGQSASWTAKSNEFTELPETELEKLLGYNPPPDSGELTLAAREMVAGDQARLKAGFGAFGAPAAFDLRNVGGVNYDTPIRNQRSCGACVAFGSIATVEVTMRFTRQNAALAVDLSENHLFNCIARSQGRNCTIGWWVAPAMTALRDEGVVDEACSPYSPVDQPCTLCPDEAQRRVRILSFEELRSVAAMKDWLSKKGALAACFSVYSDFTAYASGVYRRTAGSVLRGGHCVCVIGYDDAARAWICKNSWGDGWGDGGYFRIGYGECGIDATMWGVQTGASPTPGSTYVPLYRYWNPSIADHFYTTSWLELGEGRHGWGFEGVQCFVSPGPAAGLVPLHRYWNPDIGDHFYTTDWNELGGGAHGWGYEGVQCYVASTQLPGTIPLHRYWNGPGGDHFCTTDWNELGGGAYGWGYEGIQCYVWPSAVGAQIPPSFRTTRGPTSQGIASSFTPRASLMSGPGASFRTTGATGGAVPQSFQPTARPEPGGRADCGCGRR